MLPQRAKSVAPATTRRVQLSVHHDLAELEAEWRSFEQIADCTAFQSFDWLSTWQRCVGERTGVLPVVVVGRDSRGSLLFILPLATRRVGLVNSLIFLGRELCDYNAPLLAPEFDGALGQEFASLWTQIRTLLQSDPRSHYDVCVLDKMPERIGARANPFLALDVALNPSGAYLTPLAGSWDEFYAHKRSSSARKRDRNKRKRLNEAGAITLVSATTADECARTLDLLIDQKTKSFARMGVSNLFERTGYRDFFHALAAREPAAGLLHAGVLDVGGHQTATNIGLQFRGRFYHILTSYDDGDLSRYGPGGVLLQELMRHAIETGFDTFDFTIGDEPYKREWCEGELRLYNFAEAATARGRVVAAASNTGQRVKRAIKQSKRLWPLVTKLRSRLATLRGRPRRDAPPPSADE